MVDRTLITGASSGIGFALARRFAAAGHPLVLTAASDRLDGAAEAIRGEFPEVEIDVVTMDLSQPGAAQALYAAACEGGEVGIVVANAGVGVWGRFADETDLKRELAMIQVNAVSVVELLKAATADMAKRGSGRVLITASQAAITPLAFSAVYGATKAFLYSLAQALREELVARNVAVTALLPGATETAWFGRAGAGDTDVADGPLADSETVARDGYDALMRGDDHVVTPLKDRLMVAASKLVPDRMKVVRMV